MKKKILKAIIYMIIMTLVWILVIEVTNRTLLSEMDYINSISEITIFSLILYGFSYTTRALDFLMKKI
ncbi:hypothetical protein AB834_02895 [PVC group bacterium (ex Bugula neritina AB1)]|nr:hypothetical protein AB834_02895 [PVC group bacterium (ex Bugula neritina AB1)]